MDDEKTMFFRLLTNFITSRNYISIIEALGRVNHDIGKIKEAISSEFGRFIR